MEYLEGESLSSMLTKIGPINLEASCGILEPVLRALSAVHKKGIVHRDLKPDNIFLVYNEGQVPQIKLIDFGISKFTQDTGKTNLTKTGMMIGTPAYCSPEQASGESNVDHRADLYAMGVILYQMLTGGLPFVGEHYNALIVGLLTSEPRPPKDVYADFPETAEPFIMKALRKNPNDRYQSALEMIAALKTLTNHDKCYENLSKLGSIITNSAVAVGDLGEALDSEKGARSAKELFQEMATPSEWAGTAIPRRKKRKTGLYAVIGGLALLLIVGAFGFLSLQKEDNSATTAAASATSAKPSKDVKTSDPIKPMASAITVKGAPDGALIFYDGSKVPLNPFKVKKGEVMVPIRVEAKGYTAFRSFVVPNEDRIVNVTMTPVKEDDKKTAQSDSTKTARRTKVSKKKNQGSSQGASSVKAEPTSKPKDSSETKESEFAKAGRGTKFAEDFE
jgi:serine/threonine protein kinase